MEELDDEDGLRIRAFYERLGREATGFDRMELEKVEPFVEEINRAQGAGRGAQKKQESRSQDSGE